jgi:hypothetical protein
MTRQWMDIFERLLELHGYKRRLTRWQHVVHPPLSWKSVRVGASFCWWPSSPLLITHIFQRSVHESQTIAGLEVALFSKHLTSQYRMVSRTTLCLAIAATVSCSSAAFQTTTSRTLLVEKQRQRQQQEQRNQRFSPQFMSDTDDGVRVDWLVPTK